MTAPSTPMKTVTPRAINIRRADDVDDAVFELSVGCPLAREEISLEDCATCAYFKGVLLRSTSERSLVKCSYPSTDRTARKQRARPAGAGDTPASPTATATVSEAMTTSVVTVPLDMPIDTLTEIFVSRRISGAPVVDEEGRPVGVISKSDLVVDAFMRGDTDVVDDEEVEQEVLEDVLGTGSHFARFRRVSVADVMTPLVFSVDASASLSAAAALMATEGVHRLVVIGPRGKVVGLISSLDVLRWIAKHDNLL